MNRLKAQRKVLSMKKDPITVAANKGREQSIAAVLQVLVLLCYLLHQRAPLTLREALVWISKDLRNSSLIDTRNVIDMLHLLKCLVELGYSGWKC